MVRSILAYAENRLRMTPVPLDRGIRSAHRAATRAPTPGDVDALRACCVTAGIAIGTAGPDAEVGTAVQAGSGRGS